MSENSSNLLTFWGAVKIRAKNSPAYFDRLSKEAYNLFDNPEAIEMMGHFLAIDPNNPKKEKPNLPQVLVESSKKLIEKYALTGGAALEFINGCVSFELEDKFTLLNDIIGEITIQDGIVKKIDKVRYPYLS